MSKVTRVKMLDTVEDSNVFRPDELEGVNLHPYVLKQTERKEDTLVLAINRVDKIPADAVVDLPNRQAERLVSLGFAELVAA